MSQIRTIVIVALLAGAISAVSADAHRAIHQTSYRACLEHARTTFAIDRCIAAERTRLERAISLGYGRLWRDPRLRSGIARAQDAWHQFVRRDCGFAGSLFRGGTLQDVTAGECIVARERERLNALNGYVAIASL